MAATIRPATTHDFPAIVSLLERNTLPREGLDPATPALAAMDGNRLVGCAAVELYQGAALLRSVAVEADRRGEGLGRDLTRAALQLARTRGVKTVYLLTETAGGFFPKFGFKQITRDDVEPGVKQSAEFTTACPSTALVMSLVL
ncbi:MAG TPA: arsenic resistance N-acetyltransferase ArsN2 [Gemmatimonadales bacterium]